MENNGEQLKLSANVLEVLKPIIYDMTRVDYVQRSYIVKPKSEPDWMRNAKRSCAHVILDSSGVPTLAVSKREDGCLYCDACGSAQTSPRLLWINSQKHRRSLTRLFCLVSFTVWMHQQLHLSYQ